VERNLRRSHQRRRDSAGIVARSRAAARSAAWPQRARCPQLHMSQPINVPCRHQPARVALDANLTPILTWRPLRLLNASRTPVTGPCQARHHAGRVHLLGEGRAAAMYGSGSEDIEQVGVELVLGWDDLRQAVGGRR
jgi:hypothetical protein